jgi:hypothetical protein
MQDLDILAACALWWRPGSGGSTGWSRSPTVGRDQSRVSTACAGRRLVDVTVARQPRSGGSPPVCANVLFTIFQVPSIFASDR